MPNTALPAETVFWIAIVWRGYVARADQRVERLSDFYAGFPTEPSIWYGEPAAPVGAVYFVPDRLAGIHVTMTLAKDIPKAVVTAHGEVVEQLTPVSPVGYLYPVIEMPNERQVGLPFQDWVRGDGRDATHGTKPYEAFREIGVNPGISPTQLSEVIGSPGSDTRPFVNKFKAASLIRETKIMRVEVVSPALSKSTRKAELNIAEKKFRVPLRLPTKPGSDTKAEFEVEVDVDRNRVVKNAGKIQTARMKVRVKQVIRGRQQVISDIEVAARYTQEKVSLDVDVGGQPITITLPWALGDTYRGTHLYLARNGEVVFASMDRDTVTVPRGRFGEYQTARGRIKKAGHDDHCHRLQANILKKGGDRRRTAAAQRWFATSGLRMVIDFPDKTQLAPDVWLIMPMGNGWGLLVAGEYEQSALTDDRAKKKVGPYDVARQLDAAVPMLMACKRRAVQVFRVGGHRLAMLVASFREALAGRWILPNENSNAAPQIVEAQHLASREWRDELLQRLDLRL